jgi:hypothetical protein
MIREMRPDGQCHRCVNQSRGHAAVQNAARLAKIIPKLHLYDRFIRPNVDETHPEQLGKGQVVEPIGRHLLSLFRYF